MGERLSYDRHVDYETADPAKVLAQMEGQATSSNLPYGYLEVAGTRGESAYVFDMGEFYGALVQEGLGTKSLVAREVYDLTGRSHFSAIAHDTVAAVINDLVSVGARPVALNAYWSASSYEWLGDAGLSDGFIKGWRSACDLSRVAWGGGETQSLPGVVVPGALEFAGCAFGVIRDKEDLVQAKALRPKDAIVLIASNGVHANGISLVREIAAHLEAGYLTRLGDGSELGDDSAQTLAHICRSRGTPPQLRDSSALLVPHNRPRLAQVDAPRRRSSAMSSPRFLRFRRCSTS